MRKGEIVLLGTTGLLLVSATIVALNWPDLGLTVVLGLVSIAVTALILRRYTGATATGSASSWRIELVLLPVVLALHVQNVYFAVCGVTALAIVSLFRRPLATRCGPGQVLLALTLLGAIGSVALRETSNELWIVIAVLILIVQTARTSTAQMATASLIDGVFLYVIANVVAYYALGLTSPAAAARSGGLEAAAGGVRVFFPLTTSLNLAPAVAACALAASVLIVERGWKRWYRGAGALSAAVILVATNSRLALVTAILVTVLLAFTPKLGRIFTPVLALASLPTAFIFAWLSAWIGSVGSIAVSLIPSLDRGAGISDLVTLNSRNVIWEGAINFWALSTTEVGKLYGYGILGQYYSGASSSYAFVFTGGISQISQASVHNSLLQQLYDGGIIGAVLLTVAIIGALLVAMHRSLNGAAWSLATVGAISASVLTGATEVTLSPGYHQETMWIFAGLALFLFISPDSATPRASRTTVMRASADRRKLSR